MSLICLIGSRLSGAEVKTNFQHRRLYSDKQLLTGLQGSAAFCPSSRRWLMWVWSSFRFCAPIMHPAVPSLRLIDESVTFMERERERESHIQRSCHTKREKHQEKSQRHPRLLSSPAGVPTTPKTQQSAFCSKKVIIKRGENSDFSSFSYLKSDNQALQLS